MILLLEMKIKALKDISLKPLIYLIIVTQNQSLSVLWTN